MAGLDNLSKLHGMLTLILEQESFWYQGIGDRAVALLCTLAFDYNKYDSLSVRNIPEMAEAGRLVWENAGFSQISRVPHQNQVSVNFSLGRGAYYAHEQRLVLIRHARHAMDAEGLVAGQKDQSLDAVGRAQSEALKGCALLAGFQACISADLSHSKSTAERCFADRECSFVLEQEWRGQDMGDWTGLTHAQIERDAEGMYLDPPAGESSEAFQKRVLQALQRLPMNEDLAIVTSAENICTILRTVQPELLGAPGLRTGSGIKPASITELRRGPEGWRVVRIADDRHLRARKATEELGRSGR
jgi:broad specificity phosphatase PhoE